MRIKAILAAAVLAIAANVNAQGYLSDATGGNAVVVRDPARQASTQIDAAINNPAGTAMMPDGFHLSLNGMGSFHKQQSALNKGGSAVRESKFSSFTPAVQLAFKHKRWAISAAFASEGGYGKSDSPAGSIHYDEMIGIMSQLSNSNEKPSTSNMKNTAYNWTSRIGFAYRFKDVSAYVGVKANNLYLDRRLNFTTKGNPVMQDKINKWGFAPVIGIDYNHNRFNLGAKLEFPSIINVDGSYDINLPSLAWDCIVYKSQIKIPAMFSLGAGYDITDKLHFAIGSNIIFKQQQTVTADINNDVPAFNLAVGIGYRINKNWLISGGGTYERRHYMDDEFHVYYVTQYVNKLSFGAEWSPIERLQFNAGVSLADNYLRSATSCGTSYAYTIDNKQYSYSAAKAVKPVTQFAFGANYRF